MEQQPSFTQRIASMLAIAQDLRRAAEAIEAEAQRMQVASERFAARKDRRHT